MASQRLAAPVSLAAGNRSQVNSNEALCSDRSVSATTATPADHDYRDTQAVLDINLLTGSPGRLKPMLTYASKAPNRHKPTCRGPPTTGALSFAKSHKT
jgi:hypothetical protein